MEETLHFNLRIPDIQQTYTHKDEDGTMRMFMVGSMQLFIEEYPDCPLIAKTKAVITQEFVDHARTNQGLEQERLDRLCEPYLSKPCIGILWECGSLTVVDGNHRMVRLFELGRTEVDMHVFSNELWPSFVLPHEDMCKVIQHMQRDPLSGNSGIIEAEKKYMGYESKCL